MIPQTANKTMSSLEIAQLTGKEHKNLLRDIRNMEVAWEKIAGLKFELTSYIDKSNRKQPMYELTKRECLYIGTKFNDEERAKLVLRWEELETQKQKPMSTLDLMAHSIKLLQEQERKNNEFDNRISQLEAKTTTRNEDYFTIAGYGTLNEIKVNLRLASSLGRKASKVCKDRNIETSKIKDPRFGTVKTYPIEVLDEVFKEQKLIL